MIRGRPASWTLVLFVFPLPDCSRGHPCEAEVASACPERPGTETAACLKDKSQHDNPTAVSSECTDFIAIHTACASDLDSFCEEAYFSEDTLLCLTQWTSSAQLSERCSGVLAWAAPQAEQDGDSDGPTDELGRTDAMSETDRLEKEEWRKKRKAARGDAIERMKMKDVDRKKEEDRAELEKFKTEDPDGYAQMMAQQAEEKRQQADMKRKERQVAAAMERKRRADAGLSEEAEDKPKQKQKKQQQAPEATANPTSTSPLQGLLAGVVMLGLCVVVYFVAQQLQQNSTKTKSVRKPKKK